MSEPTIGEVIAAALTRSVEPVEDAASVLGYEQALENAQHMIAIARFLSRELADHYAVSFDDAWQGLGHVPEHMLTLLSSPYGWTVLGEYVSAGLKAAGPDPLIPTLH